MYYGMTYGYKAKLDNERMFVTEEAAQACDRQIIIDELSGLAPEVVEEMLSKGMTSRQEEVIDLLHAFSRAAHTAETLAWQNKRAPDAVEPAPELAEAEE